MTTAATTPADQLMTTYGAIHGVLLDTAATEGIRAECLRVLLAIAEHGGSIQGPSHDLVARLAVTNPTVIRRSAMALARAGLVTNTSRRGVGMRLVLTAKGADLATAMLGAVAAARDALGLERVAAA